LLVLENLVEEKSSTKSGWTTQTRKWSLVALERMLEIKGTGNPIASSNGRDDVD